MSANDPKLYTFKVLSTSGNGWATIDLDDLARAVCARFKEHTNDPTLLALVETNEELRKMLDAANVRMRELVLAREQAEEITRRTLKELEALRQRLVESRKQNRELRARSQSPEERDQEAEAEMQGMHAEIERLKAENAALRTERAALVLVEQS